MSENQFEFHGEKDMRKENSDFCSMWGCKCLSVDYSCKKCPILSDLKSMAAAFHIRFQMVDNPIHTNSVCERK